MSAPAPRPLFTGVCCFQKAIRPSPHAWEVGAGGISIFPASLVLLLDHRLAMGVSLRMASCPRGRLPRLDEGCAEAVGRVVIDALGSLPGGAVQGAMGACGSTRRA